MLSALCISSHIRYCCTHLVVAHWHHLSVGVAIRLVRVYAFFELGNLLQGIQSLGLLVHDLGMVGLSFRVRETAHPIDSSSARYLIRDREGGENPNPRPLTALAGIKKSIFKTKSTRQKKVEVKREHRRPLEKTQVVHRSYQSSATLDSYTPGA